jgi:transcriptional regulator GlxA family with amidase domain
MPEIAILAAPNVAGSSLFGTAEFFAAANRIILSTSQPAKQFNITLYSLDGAPVKSIEGVDIAVSAAIGSLPRADLLYLAPPSISSKQELTAQSHVWADTVSWLRSEHERYHTIASHCCGSFLLAQTGLLTGGRATTAWWLSELLAAEHPELEVDHDAIVVRSGKCVTAAGTGAYQDLALAMLREFAGTSVYRLTSKYLMADRQRRSQSAYRLTTESRSSQDELVIQARCWIKKHLSNDFKIGDLASALNASPRTLLRRVQQHTGGSLQALIQAMRIEHSKVLFETTALPLTNIARRCGYHDESAFRRVFKQFCAVSPNEYRLRFNPKHDDTA